LIDFHSTVNPSIPYHHGLVLSQWQNDPFWLAQRSLEPAVLTAGAALVDFTGAKFGRDVLGAEFSATFETVFPVNETISRYASLGRNFGMAWDSTFNVTGDLNFDGALNVQDWLLFVAGSETEMNGYSAIQRYERGDLDGDGQNSFSDFALFKEGFEFANGAGSFAAMLASVPEPTAIALSATAVVFAQLIRCRRRRASTYFDLAAYDKLMGDNQ
jgi:hypothetical protein